MEIPLIRSGSRSLSGIPPNRGQFEGTGLRDWVIEDMFAIIEDFSIKLHPDSYETALIAALAATSPDRGISSGVDYKILSNIQVQCSLMTRDKRLYLESRPMSQTKFGQSASLSRQVLLSERD